VTGSGWLALIAAATIGQTAPGGAALQLPAPIWNQALSSAISSGREIAEGGR
jgi:hypothetical protein